MPVAARTNSVVAVPSVIAFRIRRCAESTAAAPPRATQSADSTITSELAGNAPPEHIHDLTREELHCRERKDRDEGCQHRVFEQVLAVFACFEPTQQCHLVPRS